jgi:ectoine hydroxylase-related dioxygenase (phytanoyl-CoA dioxygenase family)
MEINRLNNKLETHLENIDRIGYTIIEDVISQEECKIISSKLDEIDEKQIKEFSMDRLQKLKEKGIIRALVEKDDYFVNLILNQKVFEVVSSILGDTAILHLQNGIVVEPEIKHGQSHFHRDFAKDFTSSKPLSINAFWIIDDFNEQTGATWVVPYTHKSLVWPSEHYLEKNAVQINAKSGSIFVFDSMLIHRGGNNRSNSRRRAVNHQYTRPFIKQQIDLPSLLKGRYDIESKLGQVLGFWSVPPKSVREFRNDPDKRTYRSGQG